MSQKRIHKFQKLVRYQKLLLDEEVEALALIQKEREEKQKELQVLQNKYMKGIEDVNKARSSQDRESLSVLEQSIDLCKMNWTKKLKELQIIQAREASQQQQLELAYKEFKKFERAGENIEAAYLDDLRKTEAKKLDEFATQSYRKVYS